MATHILRHLQGLVTWMYLSPTRGGNLPLTSRLRHLMLDSTTLQYLPSLSLRPQRRSKQHLRGGDLSLRLPPTNRSCHQGKHRHLSHLYQTHLPESAKSPASSGSGPRVQNKSSVAFKGLNHVRQRRVLQDLSHS